MSQKNFLYKEEPMTRFEKENKEKEASIFYSMFWYKKNHLLKPPELDEEDMLILYSISIPQDRIYLLGFDRKSSIMAKLEIKLQH